MQKHALIFILCKKSTAVRKKNKQIIKHMDMKTKRTFINGSLLCVVS